MSNSTCISFDIFNEYPELVCAFSTRQGGVSTGIYHSLNLGYTSGDAHHLVETNRTIFFKQLGIKREFIAAAGQIHSANVKMIANPGFYPNTDALICREKGVFLTVQTADCFPLMIYIPDSEIVAVVHCGWRGVVSGIVERVLKECNVSLGNALAVIGPGIQKKCFEVGADVYMQFQDRYLAFHKEPQKRLLNLQGVIVDSLLNAGFSIDRIHCESTCTHCAKDLFYSYRRDGAKSGRMQGIIGMV
jgi:YfiH family protein